MKKIILPIAIFSLTSAALFAQIPNNGFENWTSMGSYSNPNGWDQLNSMTTGLGVYTCTKGTPGNPGTAYLKLTSKTVTGMGVVPGVAVCGKIDPATMKPKSGFAYAGRPTSLTGSWQHMISGNSQGAVSILLTRWDVGMNMRMTVGSGTVTLSGMAMSWANFSVPLTYKETNAPDSCIIVLSASGTAPADGDYLWVDNLAFTGSTVGFNSNNDVISNVSAFPNPVIGDLTVELNAKKTSDIKLQLLDMTGKLISEVNSEFIQGDYKHTINTSSMAKGIYFLKVIANDAIEIKKIVVQ